ncbi:MAG: putative exported protein of unknown function [Ramlibacter sp.]|jgi:hypothetical protein|nr:putative exported protein of unknown function [Ramlibacter sp.]
MKRKTFVAMALLTAGLGLAGCSSMGGAGGQGWQTLIDGNSGLDNFNRIGDANWRAEGGAIVADKGAGGFLVTKKSYKDFQIRAEFWAEETTNSGIFIRVSGDTSKVGSVNSYEVNIFDQRPDPAYGTGAIVSVAKVDPMPKAAGKWNVYEITAKGPEMTIVLNGKQTVVGRDAKFTQGPFALQYALGAKDIPGGAIKWRKVQVREL